MANANRTKGHNLEREIVRIFRDVFGFSFTKTSRASSRLLDDSGIDVDGIPFNIQIKSGYTKNPPKYVEIYRGIIECLRKNYPPTDPRHHYPIVLIHKDNSRKPEDYQWIFRHADIVPLLEDYFKTKQQLYELQQSIAKDD